MLRILPYETFRRTTAAQRAMQMSVFFSKSVACLKEIDGQGFLLLSDQT